MAYRSFGRFWQAAATATIRTFSGHIAQFQSEHIKPIAKHQYHVLAWLKKYSGFSNAMTGFTLTQLRTFLMVHRAKSFQAAANALHTTQPAVSQRVKELERVLGLDLFLRESRSVRLTVTGRKLLPFAERMVCIADEIAVTLTDKHAVSGLIKIGATDTVALTWLPKLVQRLRLEYPRLEVELVIGLSVDLLESLRNHDLDIAMVACPFNDPNIASMSIGKLNNHWMASPQLISQMADISPLAMSNFPIFTHSEGTHQHEIIRRWFRESGIDNPRINVCTSLAAIVKLTTEGLGISVLSPEMMVQELEAGALQMINFPRPLPSIAFAAAYIDRGTPQLLRHLADLATEIVAGDRTFGDGFIRPHIEPLPTT